MGEIKQHELIDQLVTLSQETAPQQRSFTLGQAVKEALAGDHAKQMQNVKKDARIAERRCTVMDAAIRGVLLAGEEAFPEVRGKLVVNAVGGYGRGRLAPHSDIDLLFFHKANDAPKIEPLLNFVLYALYDSGQVIAQAVHTPTSAVEFVKTDLNGQTSYLDVRFLAGDQALFDGFVSRYNKFRIKSIPNFVQAKLDERDARHADAKMSRYAVEPDVKEGKGGLRDLETLFWLDRYAFGRGTTEERVKAGAFWRDELESYQKASDFLWSVRVQIHDIKGRGDDRLTFDIQPEVAARLGYKDRGKTPAVERLMKHYFITTKEVARLTSVISTLLEEEALKQTTSFGEMLTQWGKRSDTGIEPFTIEDEAGTPDNLLLRRGRFDFVNHQKALETPIDMFRLFRAAGREQGHDIRPEALKTVARGARKMAREERRDAITAEIFKAILLDSHNVEATLRGMLEAGLLGNYIRPFGGLIGKVEYGLYRRHTIDEHVLRSVGVLQRLRKGQEVDFHPLATKIIQNTDDPLAFFLTILMHETSATMSEASETRLYRRIVIAVRRFFDNPAVPQMIAETIVKRNLLLETAARRSVTDPKVVESFVAQVGKVENLKLLLVLTISHLRVAGIDSWDRWIRRDISTLYNAAMTWFEGGAAALEEFTAQSVVLRKTRTQKHLKDFSAADFDKFAKRVNEIFWVNVSSASAARVARLVRDSDAVRLTGNAKLTRLDDGLVEVIVYSRDRPGLFSDIAATAYSVSCVVRAAVAFSTKGIGGAPDMVTDIFMLQADEELTDDQLVIMTHQFTDVVQSSERQRPALAIRFGDRRQGFDVPAAVRIDLESSEENTIIEAEGRDRPGLLYQLSDALSNIGVSIQSAYVATYGEVAIDSFYVQDLPGYKITDPRRLKVIERALMTVLKE